MERQKAHAKTRILTYEEVSNRHRDEDLITVRYDGIEKSGHWYEDHMLKMFSECKLSHQEGNTYLVKEFPKQGAQQGQDKRLQPGGIVTDMENFDFWEERFPEDDVTTESRTSMDGSWFEALVLLADDFAKLKDIEKRVRIVLDYDPHAKKMVITHFHARENTGSLGED